MNQALLCLTQLVALPPQRVALPPQRVALPQWEISVKWLPQGLNTTTNSQFVS